MASTLLFQATKLKKMKTNKSGQNINYTIVKKNTLGITEITGTRVSVLYNLWGFQNRAHHFDLWDLLKYYHRFIFKFSVINLFSGYRIWMIEIHMTYSGINRDFLDV